MQISCSYTLLLLLLGFSIHWRLDWSDFYYGGGDTLNFPVLALLIHLLVRAWHFLILLSPHLSIHSSIISMDLIPPLQLFIINTILNYFGAQIIPDLAKRSLFKLFPMSFRHFFLKQFLTFLMSQEHLAPALELAFPWGKWFVLEGHDIRD